ncbi:MAG: M16 family metallopeptidase [Planctomycetota bacterium]|jgi:zinc protease
MSGTPLHLLLGLVAAAAFTSVVPAAQAEDRSPLKVGADVFEHRILSNGLQALAIREDDPTTTVFLSVAVGNRNETAATTGLAHLTEHAMFAGTATTGTDVHEKTIVGWGGESNAYTRDDYTMYYDHGFPSTHLEEVLAMEADRLVNLSLESKPVLHERHRLELEEKHSYRTAEGRAQQLEAAVYQLHPYRFGLRTHEGHTRGPLHSVATIRDFYRSHYHPNRVAVVVIGPHEPEVALDAIEAACARCIDGCRMTSRFRPSRSAST